MLAVVRRPPARHGLARSRWWIVGLALAIPWLGPLHASSVCRLLRRLGVRYKRGRRYVHSPDPDYAAKLAAVRAAAAEADAAPGRVALLYLDELTYYRRPVVARGFARAAADAPRADQGHGANTKRRIVGAFEPRTGRLFARQWSHAGRANLVRFYAALTAAYPEAQRIYVAQDNWPVHFHPDVLRALEGTPVRLLRLPTYAPWTNPIEKVWRKLHEDLLYLHHWAEDWERLKAEVSAWLARFDKPSEELRRYVGCTRNNL